jgi:hypothetical protein
MRSETALADAVGLWRVRREEGRLLFKRGGGYRGVDLRPCALEAAIQVRLWRGHAELFKDQGLAGAVLSGGAEEEANAEIEAEL